MSSARDTGFTLIELLIVVAIIAIIVALATTGLLRARAAANEASAIAAIRVTNSSQKGYAVACGRGAYAPNYVVLGTPPPGGGPAFISPNMGGSVNPQQSGFRFSMTAGAGSIAGPPDCNNGPTISAFYASATPLSVISGARSFAINGDGAVWQLDGGSAPTEPFGLPATPVQ